MSQDIEELEEVRRLMYEASSPHLSRNIYYALENFEISGCQIAYSAISDTIAEIIKFRKNHWKWKDKSEISKPISDLKYWLQYFLELTEKAEAEINKVV